jgi:cell division cycle 2-like
MAASRRGEIQATERVSRLWAGVESFAPTEAAAASSEAATPAAAEPAGEALTGLERYQVMNHIASGSYGLVSRARDRTTGHIVALKQVDLDKAPREEGFPTTILREIHALQALKHPNLMELIDVVCTDRRQLHLVMEYCEHDVKSFQAAVGRAFSEAEVKRVSIQLLEGLAFMHRRWFAHRDLKPANLLWSADGTLRIADFGLARTFSRPLTEATSPRFVVTPAFRPIEMLLGEHTYGPEIDVWSAACIILELLSGETPFPANSEAELVTMIFRVLGVPSVSDWPEWHSLPYTPAIRGLREVIVSVKCLSHEQRCLGLRKHLSLPRSNVSGRGCVSDAGIHLLVQMLELNPKRRITVDQALEHPWFTSELPLPQPAHLMPRVEAPSTGPRVHSRFPGLE